MNRLAEKVAVPAEGSKTEAVRTTLVYEAERLEGKLSLAERVRPIQERIAAYPDTGLEADKAFYDSLYRDS